MKRVAVYHAQTKLQVWEGERKGESLLFLHPQGSRSSIWNEMLPHFTDKYHPVCMDLRGHGESDFADKGYDIETVCRDILAVLDQLQIPKAHLIGNSLGGDFAVFFAAFHPERTASLCLLDAGMINYIGPNGERDLTREEVLAEFAQRPIKAFEPGEDIVPDNIQRWVPWEGYFAKWFQHTSRYPLPDGRIAYQIPTRINLQIMETVCDLCYEEAHRHIRCPILFLPAETEPMLSVKLQMIERVPAKVSTKTVVLADSRHLMPLDQPIATAREIRTFLAEIAQPSSATC
ncbi:UNVERIFIED_CONTAM: 2-succinyl-6-hydroxy-2,4-cyclohexadiene-1-carboxylate synthase [Brevibacillus sp. OAP136]